MQASIVDLRYKSNDILAALDHGEEVVLLYRGKPKGTISPLVNKLPGAVSDHPFFGMNRHAEEPVEVVMEGLRGGRYDL
jgi:antitoxin (DNA-binding transcriptional repressor) of toxin-antitoxin stability system